MVTFNSEGVSNVLRPVHCDKLIVYDDFLKFITNKIKCVFNRALQTTQDENQIPTQYGHLALETSNCDRGRYPAAIHSSVLLQTLRLSRSSVEDRGCLLSTVFPPCIMRIEFL